jgi:LysR family transcriptional regulator for metE and metH
METKFLQLIDTIVTEGSLTKASAKLFLSQAALSHQLKDIETRYRVKLFKRIKNRLIITEAGSILLTARDSR